MKVRTGFRIFVAIILLCFIGTAFYLFSGRYNVAADEAHWAFTSWMLETIREQSISARLDEIEVPALDDEARIRNGAVHYDAMCAGCHLKPGRRNSEIRQGLNPTPPSLAEHAEEPAEAFWVTKHGIRMTGMPAWGETHGNREIWDIVAFLQVLPELTPDEYAELAAPSDSGNDGHAHDHGDAHSAEESGASTEGEETVTEEPQADDGHDHEH